MSAEHLERIEQKIDRVLATQVEHTQTLGEHTLILGQHTTKLEAHSQRFEQLDRRLAAVEVTLENTVPQAIMQIADGHAALQASIDRGFADIKEHIEQRLGPLKETVRRTSATLSTLAGSGATAAAAPHQTSA